MPREMPLPKLLCLLKGNQRCMQDLLRRSTLPIGSVRWQPKRASMFGRRERRAEKRMCNRGGVYITHGRILDEIDCCCALAKLGVSRAVIISEGLGFLSEHMDIHFNSFSKMALYEADVDTIMSSMNSSQGKGVFSRFAHALYNGYIDDGEVYNAITRSGMTVFWDVLEATAKDNPENESLNSMKSTGGRVAEFQTLKAWSKVFMLLEERHQHNHTFNFIKGDIELAEAFFEVFKFIAMEGEEEKYKELSQVMHAAIPMVAEKIAEKKMEIKDAKVQEEEEDDEMVRNRLLLRKLL